MKKYLISALLLGLSPLCMGWGFYAHRLINYQAVFSLPPDMLIFYKAHIGFLAEHAVDPDKRRYLIPAEGPRHFIDLDRYGNYPFSNLPRSWKEARENIPADTLQANGIGPWWIQEMMYRLEQAFRGQDQRAILKLSADIGHYLADAHVPLHASSNHNGQLSGQEGIHGFWESRLPELLAENSWDFFVGKALYLKNPASFIWQRVFESAAAADTVLQLEARLNAETRPDRKYAFEPRNGRILRQYSLSYALAYNQLLNNMVERRMQQSILAVASFWYTAWVNAGQPDLGKLQSLPVSAADSLEYEALNRAWRQKPLIGRRCD